MQFRVIIPVRLHAKRLPNKPLLDSAGKPMIQHVYENAVKSGACSVVIATDSMDIVEVCQTFGAAVCMTSADHKSGTERLAEAVEALGYDSDDIVVNVQGDEPLMPASIMHQAAHVLDMYDNAKVATIAQKIQDPEMIFDPNTVKVVINKRNHALYFSRAPIPWDREGFKQNMPTSRFIHLQHIGIYAYRVGFLQEYLRSMECDLEKMEMLEQLRILWHGQRIHVSISENEIAKGVDTQEDLDRVRKIMDT